MKHGFYSVAALLLAVLLCFATGCKPLSAGASDLMEGIEKQAVNPGEVSEKGIVSAADFAAALLKGSHQNGSNSLVSPLSVLLALAMTANGAAGDTLKGMEDAFSLSLQELNDFCLSYTSGLENSKEASLHIANSLWFNERSNFEMKQKFLQKNADYYDASLYRAPFDEGTMEAVNDWVDQHTNGMIDKILDEIDPMTVLYLVNALAFEAEWAEEYYKISVGEGIFHGVSGDETVEMMHGSEYQYLEDEEATGFIKAYKGGYSFAALLPKESVGIEKYIAGLTGEKLKGLFDGIQHTEVNTALPKFENKDSMELSKMLIDFGMGDAFDPGKADFSNMAVSKSGDPLYISDVIHKTFISVTEKGTRAGAATLVEMKCGAAMPPEEPKRVILDRPFVYLIVDNETHTPIFIGAELSIH